MGTMTKIGSWILEHRWVCAFPIVLSLALRTIICDRGLSLIRRGITVLFDLLRTFLMYTLVLKFLHYLININILDRIFFSVVGFFAMGLAYYFIIDFSCALRTAQLTALHGLFCAAIGAISAMIAFPSLFQSIGQGLNWLFSKLFARFVLLFIKETDCFALDGYDYSARNVTIISSAIGIAVAIMIIAITVIIVKKLINKNKK